MAPKSRRSRSGAGRKPARRPAHRRGRTLAKGHFVGRDPSPVLDRYPPKTLLPTPPVPGATETGPTLSVPHAPVPPPANAGTPPGPTAGPSTPPEGLIRLERPFDADEFSRLLGETAIRITVPRDALPEVLRRVTEFMGFGIYVYSITVRPAPSELLHQFVVELQRVDYDPTAKSWRPFVERGAVGTVDGGPAAGP